MKRKVIGSIYNPGYDSWVCIATKYGIFDGYCQLDEEDSDIDNSFDGMRIAEFRASLKAYKQKARKMRDRADGVLIAYNNLSQTMPATDPTMVKLYKQYLYFEKEAEKVKEYCDRMTDYQPIFIDRILSDRREAREKYNKE